MSALGRRVERIVEAINQPDTGCDCDGEGSVLVVRFVEPGESLQEAPAPPDIKPCPAHGPIRIISWPLPRSALDSELCLILAGYCVDQLHHIDFPLKISVPH